MSDKENLPVQPEGLIGAIRLLVEAASFAANIGCDRERYAVEIVEFKRVAASHESLRWLCDNGYALHLSETTQTVDPERSFNVVPPTVLSERSCWVLADDGVDFANSFLLRFSVNTSDTDISPQQGLEESTNGQTPHWDDQNGELSLGRVVVKRLISTATFQRLLLQALQEEGWPSSIDDPLPPGPEGDATLRLRSVIRGLNASQLANLIRFKNVRSRVFWYVIHFHDCR